MLTEIDILLHAANKDCAVVEKDSHVLWSREDLLEARETGRYPEVDQLAPPAKAPPVSGPYPGCMQRWAAPVETTRYRLVGQTTHFWIFAPTPPDWTDAGAPRADANGCASNLE